MTNLSYDELQAASPKRFTKEAILTLDRGYLLENETPYGMIDRQCSQFANYYPYGYNGFTSKQLYNFLFEAMENCWISPSSPAASNFGANRALPVSCFGISVQNSVDGIFKAAHEAAMLTKNAGGIGMDLSNLIGPSKVISWAKLYDVVMSITSQAGVRRGNVALYLDVFHPDFELFLNAKDLLRGGGTNKLTCNIAVKIPNKFMNLVASGDSWAKRTWHKILEMRMTYGSPYLYFDDNVFESDPPWYKDKGLKTTHSQLCSEIFLHSDAKHTYSCVLSSLNLRYFDEWRDNPGISLPELGILYLDAINEEFIQRGLHSKHPEGLKKAINGAIKGRPLGLGVYGYHAWLMKNRIAFESVDARIQNHNIFEYIRREAEKATHILAVEKGEPEWCQGWGRRNTHLLAIAPTTTSSIIGNGVTPGIQPIASNYFSKSGAKGTFIRKNPFLEELLEEKGFNDDPTWEKIRNDFGSVRDIDCLSDKEKEIFKGAYEINQQELIDQAAMRQEFIDQGQSLNLFIRPDEDAQKIFDLHVSAWAQKLKTLYYVYSESMLADIEDKKDLYVFMKTRNDCSYCQKAKKLLDERQIPYATVRKIKGKVPEIWINGEQLEDGYTSLVAYLGAQKKPVNSLQEKEAECASCDG